MKVLKIGGGGGGGNVTNYLSSGVVKLHVILSSLIKNRFTFVNLLYGFVNIDNHSCLDYY